MAHTDALQMFFILFAPQDILVAGFAEADDAINYVLNHLDTYGFVPNHDMVITNAQHEPILSLVSSLCIH